MDVVALQEIRWKGKGSIRNVKFALHYSGNDRQGNRDVGFIVSKKASRSVLGFLLISEKICILRIKGKFHNITFINVRVYAPTEDAEDETEMSFMKHYNLYVMKWQNMMLS